MTRRLLIHLGTQKAASTTLWQLVRQNPQVATHKRNELAHFKQGLGSDRGYLNHFPTSAIRLFENSPKYFSTTETPERIAREMRAARLGDIDLRFSVVLRDPVGYLFSLYSMYRYQGVLERRGNPPYDDFAAFIAANPGFLRRAEFGRMLEEHWLARFDLSRFHILFFEELIRDTPAVWDRTLVEALGSAPFAGYDMGAIHRNQAVTNPVGKVVLRALEPVAGLRRVVGRALGSVGLKELVRDGLRGNAAPLATKDVSEDAREIITRAYRADMQRLSALIGRRDLPWPSFRMSA